MTLLFLAGPITTIIIWLIGLILWLRSPQKTAFKLLFVFFCGLGSAVIVCFFIVVGLFGWSFLGRLPSPSEEAAKKYRYEEKNKFKVLNVISGHVLEIDFNNNGKFDENERVKLLGVMPLNSDSYNFAATAKSKDLLLNKYVYITYENGVRGQVYIFTDDKLYNAYLVEKGLAVADRSMSDIAYHDTITEAEQKARSEQVNVWCQDGH